MKKRDQYVDFYGIDNNAPAKILIDSFDEKSSCAFEFSTPTYLF